MPKLILARYYRRDRGTKWGWRLLDREGLEIARINPKWHTEGEAREGFEKLFKALAESVEHGSWNEITLQERAEVWDV